MDSKELSVLLGILRSQGVLYYKAGGVEIQLGPQFEPPKEASDSKEDDKNWRGYSPEDLSLLGAE